MFTDIAGYTRMTQANESAALELLEEHRGVLRPIISTHGGTEVKTIGDAFLIEFKSALDAVTCGVEMQRKMAGRNASVPEPRRVRIRIGIHLGDVVHSAGDVYGDAVNVASRVEPIAEAGGVCISQQVYDNIRNKTELQITKVGEVELKNVDLPMAIYSVRLPESDSSAPRRAPRERLAVLPFVNISPDPSDEYFADGLTEELITKLSEVKGLKVIARTSVMNYKKKEKSVSQIGRELDAGSIIEGSVRKAGNRIRVTVQLIDSRTEEHLWASHYDKELDDIFAIQSDVAAKVAGSVSAGLLQAPAEARAVDVEAYTLYLKAVQLVHEGTEPGLREAVSLLERALKKDGKFARAHAALGNTWATLATGGYEDFDVVEEKAEPLIRKALELEPESAEANAAMAHVCNVLDRFDQVRTYGERALRTNPNLADTYVALGVDAASMLRLDEGLSLLEKAHELDPLETYSADLLARVARVAGKNDKAIAVLRKMDQLSPSNPRTLSGLAESYMLAGDFEKAQDYLTRALRAAPHEPLAMVNQGLLFAVTGRRGEAETMLAVIGKESNEAVRNYGRLFISSALGNFDDAFRALDRAAEMHAWPFLIGSLPIFSELRRDPRYVDFARKVGLPPPSSA
jgi:TolB-like protein/Tfp pilus assembly protein PilF